MVKMRPGRTSHSNNDLNSSDGDRKKSPKKSLAKNQSETTNHMRNWIFLMKPHQRCRPTQLVVRSFQIVGHWQMSQRNQKAIRWATQSVASRTIHENHHCLKVQCDVSLFIYSINFKANQMNLFLYSLCFFF